jgi:hypothetical protein
MPLKPNPHRRAALRALVGRVEGRLVRRILALPPVALAAAGADRRVRLPIWWVR